MARAYACRMSERPTSEPSESPVDIKPHSRDVTDGYERAPARAMLRAIGMTDDDWGKSQVGVCSSWNEVTPCNMPLDRLAKRSKEGVRGAGAYPIEFNTIAVSDGISMGHEGMRASLVSREVIADSIELMARGYQFDAIIAAGHPTYGHQCYSKRLAEGLTAAIGTDDLPPFPRPTLTGQGSRVFPPGVEEAWNRRFNVHCGHDLL